MAQLTIYVDEGTRKRIAAAAKREKTSISKWVQHRLVAALDTEWPEGYFECFGVLHHQDFHRPEPLREEDDAPRETIE